MRNHRYSLSFFLFVSVFTLGIYHFFSSSPPIVTQTVAFDTLDNTKTDWWLTRSSNHETPGFNDKLSYELATYDAYAVGNTDEKVLYLTFDEGYENGYTAPLLDTLKAKGVKAIFFVTSPYIQKEPELILRMVNEGHLVANHSKSHPSMPKYTSDPQAFNEQLEDVAHHFKAVTGQDMPKLFRPPMGHYSQKSLAMTQALGYKTIFWSFAYKDFDINDQPALGAAKKKILDNLHNGAIILLHAVSKTNAEVLGEVIDEAHAMGYRFELFE